VVDRVGWSLSLRKGAVTATVALTDSAMGLRIERDARVVVENVVLGIVVDGVDLGSGSALIRTSERNVTEEWFAHTGKARGRHRTDHRELTLELHHVQTSRDWVVRVRVSGDGVALRYGIPGLQGVATLTADQRVEMLDDCWDEYSKGVVKALSRDANLAPELTWSTDTDLPRSERVPIWHYSFARDDLLIHRERLRHQSQVRALAQRRQEALEKGARDAARQQVTEAKHAQRQAQHAEALALHAGGLSHQKVADRVGVTRSTVEAWVRQVRLAADPEGGKDYHDRMARERVDRALRATRPQEESLSRKEIRVDLNCGQEAVKALLRDGRFYRDPQADQHRLDIALRARNLLADGVVKDKIAAALNLTTPATIRACRDAFALEHLNYPAGQPTPRSAGQAPLPA